MDAVRNDKRVPASLAADEERSARRDWLFLALATFLLLIPLPVGGNRPALIVASVAALGLLSAVYWLVRSFDRRVGAPRIGLGRVVPALFALFCLALVLQMLPASLLWINSSLPDGTPISTISFAPTATLLLLLQVLGYGLFALLAAQVAGRWRSVLALVRFAVIATVIYAAIGLILLTQAGDTYFGIPKEYYLGSATGPFINRNSFATFLAMGLAASSALFCYALSERQGRITLQTMLVAVGILVISVALFATNSRMGIFAGLTGGLFALVLGGVKARFPWWLWGLVLAALVGAGVLLAPELGAGVLERLLQVEGALRQRLVLYDQIVTIVAQYPWTGVGGGTFEWAFPVFHVPPLTGAYVWDRGHSTYLTLWAELGLIGGTLPILIMLWLAGRAMKDAVTSPDRWVAGVAAVAAALVVAIHSLVDFSVEIPANAFFLIAYLVAGATIRRERRRVA